MYFYRKFFHIIVAISIVSITGTSSIESIHDDVNQVEYSFSKKIIEFCLFKISQQQTQISSLLKRKNEKFYGRNQDQRSPKNSESYLITMLPVSAGGHPFNSGGEQEWQIQTNTDTEFVIYGMQKD